jgi:hypothetical protein
MTKTICFIESESVVRVVADCVGREARGKLLAEVTCAWIDQLPEAELFSHFEYLVSDMGEHDLSALAGEIHPTAAPTPQFLLKAFSTLGERQREILRLAACLRFEEALEVGVPDRDQLDRVLPRLPQEVLDRLAQECVTIYINDRLGSTS